MRYGFCKEFSTPLKAEDYESIKLIKDAGFDFIEMRAMLVSALHEEEFQKLADTLKELELDCDCFCALFPRSIRVTGAQMNYQRIAEYIERTFSRCSKLGAKSIVFGSAPARALDEKTTEEMGYEQLSEVIHGVIVPACEKYDITVVMEPLSADQCNFIHTLADGMKVVDMVKSDRIQLLGDTMHMMSNHDNAEDVVKYADSLKHVHIAEMKRMLPEYNYSPFVKQVICNLKEISYNGTISFETKNGEGIESLKRALELLKSQFYRR